MGLVSEVPLSSIAGVVMGELVASQDEDVVVVALYRFVRLEDFEAM